MIKKSILLVASVILILSIGFVAAANVFIPKSDDPYMYVSLGDFLIENGYEKQGIAAYEKALSLDQNNLAALNNLGYYYKDTNPEIAEKYFLKTIDIKPDYEKGRSNLARLYNNLEEYSKAADHLEILVLNNKQNIKYSYDLAINLANKFRYMSGNTDDLKKALSYFRKVYQLDPGFEHVLENIGVLESILELNENT